MAKIFLGSYVLRLAVVVATCGSLTASAAESIDLIAWGDIGEAPIAVEASLRFAGEVTGEGATEATPVSARLDLAYTQEGLPAHGPGLPRVVRRIDRSSADLRDVAKLLVVETDLQGARVAAVDGALTRGELDTVQLPADPLDIDGLLPGESVRDGGTWKVDPFAVDRLLRMRSEKVCEVVGIVSDVTPTHARLRFAGPVHGVVDGAQVEIELRGVALFDRAQGRLTRLNLAWKETRAVGPATPAVVATAKLNLTVEPADEDQRVAANDLRTAERSVADNRLLVTPGAGQWELLADRDWFVVADDRHATTLRRVADGRLAAVTTITPRTGRVPTLGEFESEVRYSLGERLVEVAATEEAQTDQGLARQTIASVGRLEGQPVEWRHDHLAGAEGSIAATTTLPSLEGPADGAEVRRMIDSLRALEAGAETAARPTAAARR